MNTFPVQPEPPATTLGTVAATLTVASAASIGSNWLDVQRGRMAPVDAVVNGLAKGTAVTVILNSTTRSTALQVGLVAGVLAGTAYIIDSAMKKNNERQTSE